MAVEKLFNGRSLVALFLMLVAVPVFADPLRVVVSFSILSDWVRVVGGERVHVSSIVGRNSDTHAFRPAPSDAKKIANADLLIVNGLGFEGWLPRLIDAAGYRGEVIVASKGAQVFEARNVRKLTLNQPQENGLGGVHGVDPHAWHSIDNAITYVGNIQRALSARQPGYDVYFKANADRYIALLQSLRNNYKTAFDEIPNPYRKVVTAHDAFVYLAADFGIEVFAPQSGSVGIGSSARRMAALVERIRDDNIRAVFLENVTDPRLLEQLSQETGVAIGGRLYSDALSDDSGEAATYAAMMQHNLETIHQALIRSY